MNHKHIAEALREAAIHRQAIGPVRVDIGHDNIEDAYHIQQINTNFRVNHGARIVGKKIGLTSFAVQQQLGVNQPDYGILFNDMEVLNGGSIAAEDLMQPKVEAEIAFVLKSDLDRKHMTLVDVINAIDYCLPAIEIVGSRIADWDIRITDTIADNASASHFVLGHTPKHLSEFDVVNCRMKMYKNEAVSSTGMGSDCIGSPLNAVLWLAQKMQMLRQPLVAGELILSGALGPMIDIQRGDHISAAIDGLGHVAVSFT